MSVKHVQDYMLKVANDYKQMNEALQLMEKTISEDESKIALANVECIKKNVEKLKENYMRISYIVWLLNKPNKESKAERYERSEKKKLDAIPEKDRLDNILKEDQDAIKSITDLTSK